VRGGNQEYLANIQGQRHGSVFEHASTSIAFLDVSRILTHELVRHRVGTAYSQESQRFVRLDNFSVYIPDLSDALDEIYDAHINQGRQDFVGAGTNDAIADGETGYPKEVWIGNQQDRYLSAFNEVGLLVEEKVRDLIAGLGLDEEGVSFHAKKLMTSALRRFVPGGVNTNILVTTNNRNWRYLIEARTTGGAEIEIREAFNQVAFMLQARHPNTFQDMYLEKDGIEVKFKHSKI
jgi:thymidylate synthase (FAD)